MASEGADRAIMAFEGGFRWLSNFYPSQVRLHGVTWPTAEHAFQGFKSRDEDDWHRMAALLTPGEAKKVGRSMDLRPDWGRVRKHVMADVVLAKFAQNTELRGWLCGTNSTVLIEGNTWHDNYWGTCHCGRASCSEPGANYLGQILMAARMVLRED